MKISEGGRGRGGGVFLKEWTTHSLSRGLVIKLRWQMVVELTPFLSISVCFVLVLVVAD